MKNIETTKSNRKPWVNAIVVVLLGISVVSCVDNQTTVPAAEYSTKIIGHWQGAVGDNKETMTFSTDSTFVCQIYPTGFIANTFHQDLPGTIHGTWKITGSLITLKITGAKNEHLQNKIASSTIVSFKEHELVLKSDSTETSSFQHVGNSWFNFFK